MFLEKRPAPPKFTAWLLRSFLPEAERTFLTGDFEEIYQALFEDRGPAAARRWYRRQGLRSLPRILAHALFWRMTMFADFLKVAWRNLKREKSYTAINIAGLAVGLAVVMSIVVYIRHEWSYDAFHTRKDRIYRLTGMMTANGRENRNAAVSPVVPSRLSPVCPEIEKAARLFKDFNPVTVQIGDRSFQEKNFFYADPEFFEIFSFPLAKGDARTALSRPKTVILTRASARKYFPREEAVGKSLTVVNGRKSTDYLVAGVAADVPAESHIQFDALVPFADHELQAVDNWFLRAVHVYLLLRPQASPDSLAAKFPPIVAKGLESVFGDAEEVRSWAADGNAYSLHLQPLRDIHLRSRELGTSFVPSGDISTVRIISLIGLFILLIAVFNFINLTTARSVRRANEVGVRKVLGSSRGLLIRQFLTESIVLSSVSFILALVLVVLTIPALSRLAGRTLSVGPLFSWPILPWLPVGLLLVGLMAGFYPAFVLASFQPARVLRGKVEAGCRSGLRNVLVVLQFAIAILLFIVTFVVRGQIRYVQTKNLGFDKSRILSLPSSPEIIDRFETFKAELLKIPHLEAVGRSGYLPGRPMRGEEFGRTGDERMENRVALTLTSGDDDFIAALGLPLAEGRSFERGIGSDSAAVVVNETAARRLKDAFHWDGVVGKAISNGRETLTIIGVLRDFHFHSLHREIQPLAVTRLSPNEGPFLVLRLGLEGKAEAVRAVEKAWAAFFPGRPFEYSFFGDETDKLYGTERKTARLLLVFSGLALVLGCLGLLGLAAYSIERRTKEIGLRKILGASDGSLVSLFLKTLTGGVALANLLAWPIAFFVLQRWLQNFAYRPSLGPGPFIAAGLLAWVLAGATVGSRALKAAGTNPSRRLKYE